MLSWFQKIGGSDPIEPPKTINYIDRMTGKIETEQRADDWILSLIYGPGPLSVLLRQLLRLPRISQLMGRLYDRPIKPAALQHFIRQWNIDTGEIEKPLAEYVTLNKFFSRRLKPAARPIDRTPGRLISPADARVLLYPKLQATRLLVKNGRYALEALLENSDLARPYEGGDVAVFRLAPQDYHRFHFPDGGQTGISHKIKGYLDSVSQIALQRDPEILCHNQREWVELNSDNFGQILLLAVGAMKVGSIVQTYKEGRVERGEEQGYFCFGGSTLVMILKAGQVAFDADLVENSSRGIETKVRMGTGIGAGISSLA